MRLTSHNGFLNSEERAMSFTLGTVGFYRYIYLAKNAVIAQAGFSIFLVELMNIIHLATLRKTSNFAAKATFLHKVF
ncbi:hypothetical protein [Photorhabdus australis]